jgi:hypothetical protein
VQFRKDSIAGFVNGSGSPQSIPARRHSNEN